MNRRSAAPVALLAVAISFGASACSDDGPEAVGTTEPPVTTAPSETTEPGTTAPDTTETAPPATEAPGTSEPDDTVAPGDEPTVDSATDVLVGLTEDEATAAAEEQGWVLRVTRRDGEDLIVTLDLRPNRVNVEVTDGEVTAVINIG